MTIIVRRTAGEVFELLSGRHRPSAALQSLGKATVVDAETCVAFEVHQVDG